MTILHGVKKPADLIHRDRFEYWRRQPDTTVMLTSDQPDRSWRDRTGVVTELFDELTIDPLRTTAFMCGPEVMIRFAAGHLRERGLSTNRIHVAIERHMQCGVGLCGHCQLGKHFVCSDGPIFPYSAIEHDLRVRGF